MMHHPKTRIRNYTRTRTRRLSPCNRHPSEPVTGFCALCLRDHLAGLDSAPAPLTELRRSKSVAAEKKGLIDLSLDPRRNSCDVRARSSLSDLFGVELKDLGVSSGVERVLEVKDAADEEEVDENDDIGSDGEIRVSDEVIVMEGDLKTMKEIIEIELESKSKEKEKRGINNFVPGASVLSEKLRKWRVKRMEKKQNMCCTNDGNEKSGLKLERGSQFRETQSEVADYGFGRRSCDTEPRFSMDAHRVSVEEPRFSLDEHRASWDGYVMARTIPRLTPMLSVVDNMTLGSANRLANSTVETMQMRSIREDDVKFSSVLDSSSSNRGNSSSSMTGSSTKTAGFGGDDVKSASNARVSPASDVIFEGTKLVITEKELKEWHLNSIKNNNNNNESASNAFNSTSKASPMNLTNIKNSSTEQKKNAMSSKWKKVCNLWGYKQRFNDKNGDKRNLEHIPETRIVRNPSYVNSTTRRYSTSDVNSGLLRLYLSPFRNSRRNKSVKSRVPSMAINGLQLH
ncbi:uncharacterized protein LOC143574578 isoform X2 [Bidens hawaiensis]|uniref:uncharacterized protein LOC143574578 isoform X2 n=1 Tax=Bidens hawaiensis TaxID=980011 RepID=UPI00404950E9